MHGVGFCWCIVFFLFFYFLYKNVTHENCGQKFLHFIKIESQGNNLF